MFLLQKYLCRLLKKFKINEGLAQDLTQQMSFCQDLLVHLSEVLNKKGWEEQP